MAASSVLGKDYRVLLVDDNELNREMGAAMLEPYGLQITQAESGMRAVELVRDAEFDLILLDYLMPEMDGLETAEKIRGDCGPNGEKPLIIALTADESQEISDAFHQRGCQAVLGKPMDEQKLFHTLEQYGVMAELPATDTAPPAGMTGEEAASFQIPGIDLGTSQISQRKTKTQYQELLSLYYEDGLKQLTLWRSVPRERVKDYHIWVHALKSASANIGALTLSDMARAQEMAAKEGNYPQIQAGFPPLMAAYGILLQNIGAHLQSQKQPDQISEPALSVEELGQELRTALELLEDFQAGKSAEAVQGLLRHPLPEEIRDLLHQAQDKLHMYQDDDAEDILRAAVETANRK